MIRVSVYVQRSDSEIWLCGATAVCPNAASWTVHLPAGWEKKVCTHCLTKAFAAAPTEFELPKGVRL